MENLYKNNQKKREVYLKSAERKNGIYFCRICKFFRSIGH